MSVIVFLPVRPTVLPRKKRHIGKARALPGVWQDVDDW